MPNNVDERVVKLGFDGAEFERGTKQTVTTIEQLKKSLKFDNASSGFENITKSARDVDVSNILAGVDALQQRFSTLGIIGMTVIQNLTTAITTKLSSAIFSIVNQIKTGGINRAMNIENAHFQLQGLISDETEVQKIMDQALDSVDGTAYAYDEAAKAASMFAASGVAAGPELYNALRGIAGVAATTNAQYSEISSIFTTVAGQGKVMSYQLNQLAFRGMNAAAALTNYFNGVNDGSITASDSVKEIVAGLTAGKPIIESDLRELVSNGKISFDLFSEAMATTFGEHAKDANKTFTGAFANIKAALSRTGAMFISPLIEQEGPFVGFFNAIRVKINEMNSALKPAAERVTTFINDLVKRLTDLTTKIDMSSFVNLILTGIGSVLNLLSSVKNVVSPVVDVFKSVFEIFSVFSPDLDSANKKLERFGDAEEGIAESLNNPPKVFSILGIFTGTLGELAGKISNLASKLGDLISSLKPTEETLGSIKNTLSSFVELVKTGFGYAATFVSSFVSQLRNSEGLVSNLKDFFSGISDAIGAFAGILGRLISSIFPDFGNSVETAGSFLGKIVSVIAQVLGWLGRLLSRFAEWIKSSPVLLDIFNKIRDGFTKLKDAISNFVQDHSFDASPLLSFLGNVWDKLKNLKDFLGIIFSAIGTVVSGVAKNIGSGLAKAFDMLGDISVFDAIMGFVNALMSSGIVYVLHKIAGGINELRKTSPSAFLSIIKTVLWDVTNTLKVMQATLAAGTLKDIAKAVVLLAVGLILLSGVDVESLGPALMAVGALLAMVVGSLIWLITAIDSSMVSGKAKTVMGLFQSLAGSLKTFLTLKALSEVIKNIGISLLLLAVGVRILSDLSWEQLGKGIVTMGMLALVLAEFLVLTKGSKAGIGVGLIGIAISMLILASAVKKFGQMPIDQLIQGGVALAGFMIVLSLMLNLMPKGGKVLAAGVGLIFLATAMVILGAALKSISKIPTDGLIMSMAALITILGTLAAAFALMPNGLSMIGIGVGMLFVATAIGVITLALKALSGIPVENLIVAIGALIVVLTTLAIVMHVMNGALLGAVSMLVAAAALGVLTVALIALSMVNMERIVSGLIAVVAVLFVLGTAAMILSALWGPMLIGAGVMLALAAAGLVLGAACIVLGTGMTALGVGIKALIGSILDIIMQVVELGKALIYGLGEGIVSAVGWIISVIEQVGGLVIKVFKAIFGINSPSRVFGEIGVLNMLGLGNGMAKGSSYVTDISGAIGKNVLGEFSGMSGEFFNIGEGSGQDYLAGITSGVSGSGDILSLLQGSGNTKPSGVDNYDLGASALQNEKFVLKGVRDEATLTTEALDGTTDAYSALLAGFNSGEFDMSSFEGMGLGSIDMSGYNVDMTSTLTSVTDHSEEFQAAGNTLGEAIGTGLQEKLISLDAVSLGIDVFAINAASAITVQFDAQQESLLATGNNVGSNVVLGITEKIPEFISVADNCISGFVGGLLAEEKLQQIFNAGVVMGNRLLDGVRSTGALGIFSPSHAMFEIGEYADQGLINGIYSMLGMVQKSGEELGRAAVFGSASAMSIIGEIAGSDVVFSPVVRPVLDLTNVQNGSKQISAIFSRKQALAAGSGFRSVSGSSSARSAAKSGTTYTFTQNNYSPKALSRQEIYRQTKNQFNSFERQMKYK